jgi:2-polyprenyl-6-methoxyphenol hydroxylase-like FAD-dependent oxidoreductase
VDARPSRRDVTSVDLDVVVAGAGIGGAATALLLANAGARVTLVERVAEPRAVGAGILLQPNGLAVLYGLGLRDALRREAVEARHIDLADGDGRTLLASAVPDFGGGYDHVLVTRRSDLQSTLLDAIAREGRIACRFGWEVTATAADGGVTVQATDGTETIRADLVVGADGLHSRVRETGDFGATLTPGLPYLRGLGTASPLGAMTEYWTSLGIFGAGPVRGALYFYASAHAPPLAAALERRDLQALRDLWSGACAVAGRAFAGVERFDDLLVNRVTRVDCARWHDGRRVLLGDAVHAMAPNAGQGANSALVDAAVLTEMLATHGRDVEGALAAYAARRRGAVRRVQDASGMLGRLGEVRAPVLRALRDNAVRLVLGRLGSERSIRAGQQEEPAWLERVAARRRT